VRSASCCVWYRVRLCRVHVVSCRVGPRAVANLQFLVGHRTVNCRPRRRAPTHEHTRLRTHRKMHTCLCQLAHSKAAAGRAQIVSIKAATLSGTAYLWQQHQHRISTTVEQTSAHTNPTPPQQPRAPHHARACCQLALLAAHGLLQLSLEDASRSGIAHLLIQPDFAPQMLLS
jgi:hypothetical protein